MHEHKFQVTGLTWTAVNSARYHKAFRVHLSPVGSCFVGILGIDRMLDSDHSVLANHSFLIHSLISLLDFCF